MKLKHACPIFFPSFLGRTPQNTKIFPVEKSTIESNLEFLSGLDFSDFPANKKQKYKLLKKLLIRIVRSPLETVIGDQIKAANSLARQLNKKEPLFTFKDPGFSIYESAHRTGPH